MAPNETPVIRDPVIYLDNNATTAIDPRVADVLSQTLGGPANPASQHAFGRAAREKLDRAIEMIGECLGVRLDQPGGPRLILTSGGTESNNLALRGIGVGDLVISRVGHPSVIAVAESLRSAGRTVHWLDVDADGRVSLSHLNVILSEHRDSVGLVSVMSANNETGVLQPIGKAAELCRDSGVPMHVDATQSIGKVAFDVGSLGVSAVTFTAHKFHGPAGIGALWLDAGVKIQPLLHGGQQQLESRPGTEPVALAVAMAEALRLGVSELEHATETAHRLRNRLESELLRRHPDLVIHGRNVDRLPGTSCISFPTTDRQ